MPKNKIISKPCESNKRPRGRPKGSGRSHRSLTANELKRLRAAAATSRHPARNSCLIELALGTGLRINELLKINLGMVRAHDGSPRKNFNIGTTKNGTSFRVHLTNQAHKALADYFDYVDSQNLDLDEPLFKSQKGGFITPTSGSRLIITLLQDAGVDASVGGAHSLRRYAAQSLMKHTKGNLKLTSLFLNHKDCSQTSRYLSASKTELKDALAGMRV